MSSAAQIEVAPVQVTCRLESVEIVLVSMTELHELSKSEANAWQSVSD